MAARGARAAAERMRRIGVLTPCAANDAEAQARVTAFRAGPAATGLDRSGKTSASTIAGATAMPTRCANTRPNWSRSRRTSSWPFQRRRRAIAGGDPHRPDRVRGCRRPGRGRLCREPGAAGRQRHRLYRLRIFHRRKMAGAAQGDRAARDASGGPSRVRHRGRSRPVRRHPGAGAVARRGVAPRRRARCRRDRARRHGVRAGSEWRPDRDRQSGSSRSIAT